MRSSRIGTIRRSVALPADVVEEARAAAPPELRDNLNGLVVISLREFVARRRTWAFEAAMEEMGRDPIVREECRKIGEEFAAADPDGLANG